MDDKRKDMKNWITKEDGIPHKDGKVRFYLIGLYEDVHKYLGWYDMTEWDEGWLKVWADAQAYQGGDEEDFQVLRHDQLMDLKRNVDGVLEMALEDTNGWMRQEKSGA